MKIIFSFMITALCLGIIGSAQTPTNAASPIPRAPHAAGIPEILKQYNYASQLAAMQDVGSIDSSNQMNPVTPQYLPVGQRTSNLDIAFHPKTDVALTPTAVEAVRVSEKWRGEKNQPSAGPDGRVLYSFGAGLPTVVCAPLRVCIIELQTGEKVMGEPQIGDSVRWNISPALYGAGSDATSVIVLKPTVSGLDTNLLVTTDRRAYYLRLISKPEEYVARIAFEYPAEDNAQKWQKQMLDQQVAAKQTKREAEALPALLAVEKLNFGYRVNGGNEHLRPLRVYDDAAKVYIQMPSAVEHREAPVLLVVGNDGKGEMTNYRVRGQTYIVDRLFDRAHLVLGSGKKAQKVEIIREPKG